MYRCALSLCVAVALGSGAWMADASTIDLVIDPGFGSTENTGATAAVVLDFFEVGSDDRLTVTLTNTTPPEIGSSLTATGFELPVSPSFSVAFAPGGEGPYFDTLTFDHSVSPGWMDAPGGYDVMLTSDGNFNGGSPAGAPTEGQSETVILSLGDTGLVASELASAFADYYADQTDRYLIARFQAVGPDGEDSDMVGGALPEPASHALLSVSALALLRRKRSRC